MACGHAAQVLHSLKACSRTPAKKQTEKRHDKVELISIYDIQCPECISWGCRKTGRGHERRTEGCVPLHTWIRAKRCYERRHYEMPSNGSM